MNPKPVLSKMAVIGSLFSLMWAGRVFFMLYVSDHWFGTLGVTTLVLGTITWLSWKDRLYWYGRTFKDMLKSRAIRKIRKFGLASSIIVILLLGMISSGMHAGNTTYRTEAKMVIDEIKRTDPEAFKQDAVMQRGAQSFQSDPLLFVGLFLLAVLLVPVIFFADFALWSVMMASVNEVFGGHMIHLIDIFLIEEIEIIGILLFTRRLEMKA